MPPIQIVISLDPLTKSISVSYPPGDWLLVYGMLAVGKEVITREYGKAQDGMRIIQPAAVLAS